MVILTCHYMGDMVCTMKHCYETDYGAGCKASTASEATRRIGIRLRGSFFVSTSPQTRIPRSDKLTIQSIGNGKPVPKIGRKCATTSGACSPCADSKSGMNKMNTLKQCFFTQKQPVAAKIERKNEHIKINKSTFNHYVIISPCNRITTTNHILEGGRI